ncbi:VOC family protein [Staphylococcus intermedius]|uniref:Lactoylglutathione lyase n=1 Tax=Staphylococcus intermedius NCTC 11048 TaxID=1141106 RepID=A0A380G4Z8_STAIN|nr:VOC family protein [Staphylococcus intermedius]PCF64333.1 bleomycin resistance protein [Staphylococcus intermedius]PCF79048.1 bleomycin resistance protein [Staphylococcus intermedius]PCF80021.1 bleomycin resistance protein [Staphylococcus intermedius]PCF89319.1 bleomycin resistance protein [Staphylococcus intermedius]PNZ53132.1 VOC family protein [Staphylococcus intermedius NCTC 11048]
MKIIATSLFVDDQEKAKQFYTSQLGFELKHDIDLGAARWLTVVEHDSDNPVEIVLEPNQNPIAQDYQTRLFDSGIPATMFGVDDIEATYQALTAKGIQFTQAPTTMDEVKLAIFDDTCGNLIQIIEQK